MADGVEVIFNLRDFKAELDKFKVDFQAKTIRSATNAAAQVFKRAVIEKAPILLGFQNPRRVPGTLKRAIYVKRTRDSRPGKEHYLISFRKGKKATKGRDAFYGAFLEAGWIPRGPGKKIKGGNRSRALQRKRLLAGGKRKITEYRFIMPAFQQVRQQALAAFEKRLDDRIKRETRRQRA